MKSEKELFMVHAELFEPTHEELGVLKTHEPLCQFEVLPPQGISEGRQSRVSILEYSVETTKRRVLWKRMGAGKNLTKEEADSLHARLIPYRQSLVFRGWNVPEVFHAQVVQTESEHQIFSYEEYVPGGDGQLMIENPHEPQFLKWALLRKVTESLSAYTDGDTQRITLRDREVTLLPHGLDLKLANVVLRREDAKLFFVDLFGPKELHDRQWVSYNQKLDTLAPADLMAVTATREGALLRLYRLMEEKWVHAGGITRELLRENFLYLLQNVQLPDAEKQLIGEELHNNFPWLDAIYREQEV